MVDAASAEFDTRLARTIAAATAEKARRRLGVTPEDIAAALHIVGQGAKYLSSSRVESRAEFVARLTPAVRLVLAGLDATRKKAP
jgi:predicted RNA-binding protein with PIN domain